MCVSNVLAAGRLSIIRRRRRPYFPIPFLVDSAECGPFAGVFFLFLFIIIIESRDTRGSLREFSQSAYIADVDYV